MEKEIVVYIQYNNGKLLSCKREWNLAIWDNMDGPGEYHAKWNGQRKTNVISPISGI